MRWRGRERSENVEDRRGMRPRAAMGGGIGILGLVILFILSGGDLGKFLGLVQQQQQQGQFQQQQQPGDPNLTPQEKEWGDMVSVVLRDTEVVWGDLLPRLPGNLATQYREPNLVLFKQATQSGCGFASAQTGPFYCPADQKVYIDLGFFTLMDQRFNAPGDFAQAYVVAHEVGHHVQNLLGLTDLVHRKNGRVSEEEYNRWSVRLELQADYLAGVWAHHAERNWSILEEGDIEEAITAAQAIGDDTLQKQAQGYVVPENFTHGTSKQRMRWFYEGLKSGDAGQLMVLFEVPYSQL
ncbi:MAG: neutral zinc metallopeptidase [Planctomycetaceae bacterium]|nr:neutral zinc metallopeptidase [Planctomycetaceae bacterium]